MRLGPKIGPPSCRRKRHPPIIHIPRPCSSIFYFRTKHFNVSTKFTSTSSIINVHPPPLSSDTRASAPDLLPSFPEPGFQKLHNLSTGFLVAPQGLLHCPSILILVSCATTSCLSPCTSRRLTCSCPAGITSQNSLLPLVPSKGFRFITDAPAVTQFSLQDPSTRPHRDILNNLPPPAEDQ